MNAGESTAANGPDAQAEECIARLERLGDEVVSALVSQDTGRLLSLVAEQCRLARRLAEFPRDRLDADRLARIRAAVGTQQSLIEQGAQIAGFFMKTLVQDRNFNRVG